jgi:hypothetical protein
MDRSLSKVYLSTKSGFSRFYGHGSKRQREGQVKIAKAAMLRYNVSVEASSRQSDIDFAVVLNFHDSVLLLLRRAGIYNK